MSTTSELPKWLRMVANSNAANSYTNRAEHMRAAAARLDELERENAALKSEVEFLHLRRGQLVIERDKAREALNDLVSWFVRPKLSGPVWMIAAGENGADGAVDAARAALAGSGEP